MDRVVILYGTESGNSEMIAEDIGADIEGSHEVEVSDMTDFDIAQFTPDDFYVVICSTHGEGELPTSARPLFDALEEAQPDLSGVRYAIFGLGDSSYDTYSQGSEIIDRKLTELGAERVGTYGRHDADDGSLPDTTALAWAREVWQIA
jgi:MioC protein